MQLQTTINQGYRILGLLGSGGMGSVYAAYDEYLQREVALKLLRSDFAADQSARDRFLREAQIAARLVHRNIVRIFDVGGSAEGAYLVQELLDGQTLDQLIPLPPQRAISIAIAVAEALEYIHARGFVHCDIKPENIMVIREPDGERVVLLDFGIARAQDAHTTTLIATPQYFAPERALGAAATPASDLYALGVMLYYMLTGRLPFDGPSVHAVINAHLHAPLPPLNIDAPNAPMLAAIIGKLTAKQPAARYRSAVALLVDLHAAREGKLRPQLLRPRMPRVHATASRPNLRAWALPLLPLLAIFLVLAMTWSRGSTSDATVPTDALRSVEAIEMQNMISVPDVIGMPLDEALNTLSQSGLVGVAGDVLPSDLPVGMVTSTMPRSDELIAPGAQVVVQTSAGPAPVVPTPSLAVPTAVPAQLVVPTNTPIVPTPTPLTLTAPPTLAPPDDDVEEKGKSGDNRAGNGDKPSKPDKKDRENKSRKSN